MSTADKIKEVYDRGINHLKTNQWAKGAECFGEILKLKPDHPNANHFFGVSMGRLKRFDEALPWMEKSIKLSPRIPEYHHNLGATLRALGRFEDAERSYRKALELKPDYAEAWFNYSATKKFSDDETAIPTIESNLAKAGLSEIDQEFLHFAAGKIGDDRGEYDKAFSHYLKANRLRGHHFDRQIFFESIERIRSFFSKSQLDEFAGKGVGCDSEEPIFIVGMPRSGTTLAEQILASHPQVEGAGELPDIIAISKSMPKNAGGGRYPECVTSLPDEAFEGFARFYLSRLQHLRRETTSRIVDKMPGNFLHLGLIRCLFPRARIIHCVRDPRDTCLSCWFHRFRDAHEYSSDLTDLAYYYRLHERLMNHWKAVAPAMIFTLNYGELIDSPEQVTRDLLAFCGVDWDDACLRFHENKRAVSTASNYQVRRPLNRQGLARWERYQSHLDPLFEALREFAPLANP